MKKTTRWVGLDVHAETIAVAVAEKDGTVHSVGTIPNRSDAVRRALEKLESGGKLHVCYEAGPCGYGLYWQLAELGIECDVVARRPSRSRQAPFPPV
jgi:transposase